MIEDQFLISNLKWKKSATYFGSSNQNEHFQLEVSVYIFHLLKRSPIVLFRLSRAFYCVYGAEYSDVWHRFYHKYMFECPNASLHSGSMAMKTSKSFLYFHNPVTYRLRGA